MIRKGDLVKVKENLQYGMGVVKEQLEYIGQEFLVEFELGYGLMLKGNDFVWKNSDLVLVEKGEF